MSIHGRTASGTRMQVYGGGAFSDCRGLVAARRRRGRGRVARRAVHRCRPPARWAARAGGGLDGPTTDPRRADARSRSRSTWSTATAEQHGVCVRPFTMEVGDLDTGELRHVAGAVWLHCGVAVWAVRAEGSGAADGPVPRGLAPHRGTGLHPGASRSADHKALLTLRADLVAAYRQAEGADVDELRDEIRSVDEELRQLGMRGRLPSPGRAGQGRRRSGRRSGGRTHRTCPAGGWRSGRVGREFAGRFRPSMFVTLTCDSYGRVRDDGTPVDPATLRLPAGGSGRGALRRAGGSVVAEPAPLSSAGTCSTSPPSSHRSGSRRTCTPRSAARSRTSCCGPVTAATYHQVWWPAHDELVYVGDARCRCGTASRFVDPTPGEPLTPWD